jgi:hypothetical protein
MAKILLIYVAESQFRSTCVFYFRLICQYFGYLNIYFQIKLGLYIYLQLLYGHNTKFLNLKPPPSPQNDDIPLVGYIYLIMMVKVELPCSHILHYLNIVIC